MLVSSNDVKGLEADSLKASSLVTSLGGLTSLNRVLFTALRLLTGMTSWEIVFMGPIGVELFSPF